ncbi:MAG: SRPBCC family protein [Actinomycetota bacterium]
MRAIDKTIFVKAPLNYTYESWINYKKLPVYMPHVLDVGIISKGRTHWVVDILGYKIEFEAELDQVVPNELISWHSVSKIKHFGQVVFTPASGGTLVTVRLFFSPKGLTGEFLEMIDISWPEFVHVLEESLEGFKSYVESSWGRTGTVV